MADANSIPDIAELKKHLLYEPETGNFIRIGKPRGRAKLGGIAGHKQSNGYVEIIVCGLRIGAHRLAWLFEYGKLPSGDIDHINRNRSDNRIINLRDVPHRINSHNITAASKNNMSGWTGVRKGLNGYRVEIESMGKRYMFNGIATIEEAKICYLTAKRLLHEGYAGG